MNWIRIKALVIKEFIQMRRDRLTFAIMSMMPIVQLLIFGFSINNDPKFLPMGIMVQEESVFSRRIVEGLKTSSYFDIRKTFRNKQEADFALHSGDVMFVLDFEEQFENKFLRGESPSILVKIDATDPGAIGGGVGALPEIIQDSLYFDWGKKFNNIEPFNLIIHKAYNPEGITAYNVVPGLIGTILSMTMIMMTAMALTREKEKGTMENLLSMPFTPLEIMIGKVTPYIMVGLMQFLVIFLAGKFIFSVPFMGSFLLALACVLLFIIANLIVGYVFSTLAQSQLQAMQLNFFFFLPSMLLSGFMFPFYGMPSWAQTIGSIFPITHFLRIVRGIFLKGSGLNVIYHEMLYILAFILIMTFFAVKRFKKTLD